MEEFLGTVGAKPPLRLIKNVDPQTVIDEFWRLNRDSLSQRIQEMPGKDELIAYYQDMYDYVDLTEEALGQIIFEHEAAFVNHVLTRLTEILNEANANGILDEDGVIFNIKTSMLYDVDETIGGCLMPKAFAIRPVARLLFAFIRDQLPKIHIGIISVRKQEELDEQKSTPDAKYSIHEIVEYVDAGVVGINGMRGGGLCAIEETNSDAFDPSIYPKWQPQNDLKYVLKQKLGFSSEDAAVFEREQIPALFEAAVREKICRFPSLALSTQFEDMVYDIVMVNKGISFDGFEKLVYPLITEILIHTPDIAAALDENFEDDGESFREDLTDEILEVVVLDIPTEQKLLLKPAVAEGLLRSWNYLRNFCGSHQDFRAPDEMTSRVEILEYCARRELEDSLNRGVSRFVGDVCFDAHAGDNSFYQLRSRCLLDESGPLIMHKDFQIKFAGAFNEIIGANREHKDAFLMEIIETLGLTARDHYIYVMIALQRLAACKRQIDEGAACVAVAVDDSEVAKKMDLLFQGKLGVDGYALFGLPNSYRGRINLIHVGEMAEYSEMVIGDRIEASLAA